MKRPVLSLLIIGILLTASFLHAAEPALRVSPLFGDNACLQAGAPLPVWGWAAPKSKVTVTLGKSSAEAVANDEGRWKAELPAQTAGGPHTLAVKSGTAELQSKNILIGEVWLASGQSNMRWPLSQTSEAGKDLPAARHPEIRLFIVDLGTKQAFPLEENVPQEEVRGKWAVCSPESARDFSGVAYFFGLRLHEALGTPVGLIMSAQGSTPIQTWLPPQVWKEQTDLEKYSLAKRRNPKKNDTAKVRFDDPSACFNAGIAPLVPYALSGFLWYQGERNSGSPAGYDKLLEQLVVQWRKLWNRGDLPFYVVQLPAIKRPKSPRTAIQQGVTWADIREMQASVLKLPNTGLAVTIDQGGDLHPPHKREVGARLARLALAGSYGKPVIAQGPALASATAEDGKLVLSFRNAEGLVLRPEKGSSGIAVAGDDKVFYEATAEVQGDRIIASNPSVPHPRQARYLWADNPPATLFNGEGLPAAPFRTDDWDKFEVHQP